MKGRLNKARALVLLAAVLLIAAPAHAHLKANYYPQTWQRDLSQNFFFTEGFPGGEWRDTVDRANNAWNNQGQLMGFTKIAQKPNFNPNKCPANYGTNGIHWKKMDGKSGVFGGGDLAYVSRCTVKGTDEIFSANMVFDREENWHTGVAIPESDPVIFGGCWGVGANCPMDAWSVANHEWGHATGFSGPFEEGHFDPGGPECDADVEHTMCPFAKREGNVDWRTLSEHDVHTFTGSYPP